MDRLIWTAWRAFWVGLGASAVLVAQSLASPPPSAAPVVPAAPSAAPQKVERDAISQSMKKLPRTKAVARIRGAS